MSWRSRRIARALRSAEGAINSFRQRQGHHALRRPALDGRHRHDRNEGRLQASWIAICLLMLGTDYPYSVFLPPKGAVIQVDERARVLGRRTPTALGVIGSVRPAVKSLLGRVKPKSDSKFFDIVTAERKGWDEMLDKQSDPARSRDGIHPQAVARAMSDLAARDAVFVIDTGLNTLWSATGSARTASSGSSALSTMARSAPRLVRPTAARPSTVRASHRALRRRRFQHADVMTRGMAVFADGCRSLPRTTFVSCDHRKRQEKGQCRVRRAVFCRIIACTNHDVTSYPWQRQLQFAVLQQKQSLQALPTGTNATLVPPACRLRNCEQPKMRPTAHLDRASFLDEASRVPPPPVPSFGS